MAAVNRIQVMEQEYITSKIQMLAQKDITWKIQMMEQMEQKDITWKIQMMAQMLFAMSVHHAHFEKKNGHGTSRPLRKEKWPEI
jgi:hypothetical protein